MKIVVLHEDKNYIIVNKPVGLVVHSDGKTKEPSLVDWILENYPKMKDVGEPLKLSSGEVIVRPGIVHRIDRDTSGVLVITKTQAAFEDLKKKFQDREVAKKYHAFVYGTIIEDDGVINRPIGRSNKDFRMWSAQRGARGELREAITLYKVLERGTATDTETKDATASENSGVTFVEVEPKTGRTHQIRVHFKAINHPIVSDSLYAPKRAGLLGFERLALHAREIKFIGLDGKEVSAEAPYPADFKKAVAAIKA